MGSVALADVGHHIHHRTTRSCALTKDRVIQRLGTKGCLESAQRAPSVWLLRQSDTGGSCA
eukprot:4365246-Heterocapsa_arctica.AAC.1